MFVMLRVDLEVPMRSRLERYYADYKQAAGLLRHDLVWSPDFDAIRIDLARLIEGNAALGIYPTALTDIVQKLIATDNDLTI
jgi:hypothetical protein